MTQNNMEVVAWRGRAGPDAVGDWSPWDYWPADPSSSGLYDEVQALVTLTSAQAEIAIQKQTNEALMRERSNMIVTHREQLERLTKEREETFNTRVTDLATSRAELEDAIARAEAAKKERDALREAFKPFDRAASALFTRNFNKGDIITEMPIDASHPNQLRLTAGDFFAVRSALQPLEPKND